MLPIHEAWRRLRALSSSLFSTPLDLESIHSAPFIQRHIGGTEELGSGDGEFVTVAQYYPRDSLSLQTLLALVKMLPCKDEVRKQVKDKSH
jgi:hypothetical protein